MESGSIFLAIALFAGLYMAWNIGANDVANAMGTSVGSRALTFRQAVILAGIFEFLGAMLVGGHVTETIRSRIVSPEVFADPDLLVMGMLSALLAAAVWLNVATYFGLPVSTTHSIVGAIFGFGLLYGGMSAIEWGKLGQIVMSWVVSPIAGGVIAFLVFTLIHSQIFKAESPARRAGQLAPIFIFPVVVILALAIFYKGLHNLRLDLSFLQALQISVGAGLLASLGFALGLRNYWRQAGELTPLEQTRRVERVFGYLQICTACYVAFAHGANDVANAVGPVAGIYSAIKHHAVAGEAPVPLWILGMGAVGIVIGLGTYGYRVVATIGEKITEMTPTRGFSAEFACATTVLVCSRLGLPISTTHTLVGAVIGVGFARGIASLDRRVIFNIMSSWLITIPAAALITVLLYQFISRV